MKKKSLALNAALNAFKSALSIIFPLITYPYAFRILHANGIGKVNYTSSIISYFSLLAALGISTYAVREGAKLRDDSIKFYHFCNQVFSINIITTAVSYCLLFIAIAFLSPLESYRELLILLSLTIVFATFSIEWINVIFEDFLFITVRSIAINLISIFLLFILVKDEDDYLLYALLNVITSGCVCVSNWFFCKKYINLKFTFKLNIGKHIRPILTFFINNVATSIYVNADTTMLGYFIGDYSVGLYALAVKVYNVIKSMLSAMYTVVVPRISYHVGRGEDDEVKQIFTSVFSSLIILLLPAAVGLASISNEIVFLMGGIEYVKAALTLQILSIALIGAIVGGAITYCLNIPLGREKITAKATVLSAIINFVFNLVLIPMFKQDGAALTTAISEFFVPIYCIFSFKDLNKFLDIKKVLNDLKYALIGSIMIVIVALTVDGFVENIFLRLIAIVIFSIALYVLELLLVKHSLVVYLLKK